MRKLPTRRNERFSHHTLVYASAASREIFVVVDNVSEQIRECLQHAEDCERKAAAQTDFALRADFLQLEKHWLELAESIAYGVRR